MKKFSIKRTAALYHLQDLIEKGLVSKSIQSKTNLYLAVETEKINQHFTSVISDLQRDLKLMNAPVEQVSLPSGKLTLIIANYYDLQEEDKKQLSSFYDIIDYSGTQLYISEEEFVKRTKHADVILNNFACKVTDELLQRLPRLQYMHLSTHMHGYVDIEAFRKYHIHLSNIPYTYKETAVAEYMLAQTFALLRATVEAAEQVRTGVNEFRYFKGEQLRGKKVIIFGTDPGTRQLIELLRGLGVEIGVYCENSKADPSYFGISHFASEEEVFESGDIFYFSWTGDEYKGLVGKVDKDFLKKIKRPVYLVSVYKHKYIDYTYLRELLYAGLVKGVAFDYYPEIGVGQTEDAKALFYLPNVLITPDIAWYTADSIKNINAHTTQRLLAYAQGNTEFLLV